MIAGVARDRVVISFATNVSPLVQIPAPVSTTRLATPVYDVSGNSVPLGVILSFRCPGSSLALLLKYDLVWGR